MSLTTSNRVLMVSYHYPPFNGSSGVQRTLAFSKYLPIYGWKPIILTVKPHAYVRVGDELLQDIPSHITVKRTMALDTTRHLALGGRYFQWMALPDQWVSWFFWAIPAGLRLIRKTGPKILWSTYPIATAHCIAYVLHRITGIPWIADFRDPMTEINPLTQKRAPANPALWHSRRAIEEFTVQRCAHAVFTTPGARTIYAKRYPTILKDRWRVISNGFDEACFKDVQGENLELFNPDGQMILLHSGVLYPTPDRDPKSFFAALAMLRKGNKISSSNIHVIFRACGFEGHYQQMIAQFGLQDFVSLEPPIPYRKALIEMSRVNGLLIFQGYPSNPAIPGKLYEYLRARRPILAMVHSEGDTAKLLQELGVGTIVPLDSEEKIAEGLLKFLPLLQYGQAKTVDSKEIQKFSRESQTKELAEIFDAVK